jgi:hypothetical protein
MEELPGNVSGRMQGFVRTGLLRRLGGSFPPRRALAGLLASAMACASARAHAGFGAPSFLPPAGPYRLGGPPPAWPAERYSRLDKDTCETELGARGVAFRAVDEAHGVVQPVRLDGRLHGVTFRSELPASQRATSVYEIIDCRLALALDDFAAQLAAHDVAEVVHLSIYRPPSARSWHPSAHGRGLAIDAAFFVKRDGTRLVVERDFHGRIGARTCGGAGPQPATPESLEIRRIFCDAVPARLFNIALSPDFNWKHRNHFHLEVARTQWVYVH